MSTYRWKNSLSAYPAEELKALKFASKELCNQAIHLCWNDPNLYDLPREYADGLTMVVPAQAAELFKGLHPEVSDVRSAGDLTAERYAFLRRFHSV